MSGVGATAAWAAGLLVSYVYVGYPIVIGLLARIKPKPARPADVEPTVTLVISAFNEAQIIGEKLTNAVALDYPKDKLEILVVSDASTDATDEIVRAFAAQGVTLLRMPERGGKTVGLNAAVKRANGEVVIFSDANIMYRSDTVRRLVRNFADRAVGCVTGDSQYVEDPYSAAHVQENAYWGYERFIRSMESLVGSTVGGDGAIFAIRRELYQPLAPETINDLVVPLQIVSKGYRAVFEPTAIGLEPSAGDFRKEFRRKKRIVNRSWRGVMSVPGVLNPFQVGIFAWQVWSHKVLRWLVLPFVLLGFVGCLGAYEDGILYRIGVWAGVSSVVLAALGPFLSFPLGGLSKLVQAVFYFYLVNLAAVVGVSKALGGRVDRVGAPERDSPEAGRQGTALKEPDAAANPDADYTKPPLVVHIIFRLAMGGLENGLVNLINTMPRERYRHAIVSLTDCTDFRRRITRDGVEVITLQKKQGHDMGVYWRAWRALRRLHPAIVHTRNFPALEFLAVAACAGTARRIHGEHGRDVYDLDGSNRRYNLFRRAMKLIVHRYVAVSRDLAGWLVDTVGIPSCQVTQIYNGVATDRFQPRRTRQSTGMPTNFLGPRSFVIGTAGRMQAVKDQVTLVRAFLHLMRTVPDAREVLRLIMVGDGPLQEESARLLREQEMERYAWLPGARSDVPELLNTMDVFVLPSLAEGISNTILEAMATGLPVIATRVGGNVELVEEGRTGFLVPPADAPAMAQAIRRYYDDRALLSTHGRAARKKVETAFSLEAMIKSYLSLYDGVLANDGRQPLDGWNVAPGVSNDVRPLRNF